VKRPRRFELRTNGRVEGHGVMWDDGSASIRWYMDRDHMSFVFWPNIDVALVHSFSGTGERVNQLEWIDLPEGDEGKRQS
jgi:hypothetical protein